MSESKLDRLESKLDSYRKRASSMRANWEASTLRVINSVESVGVAAALGAAEKNDFLQGEMFGLKLEHGVAIAGLAVAVIADDESLQAHAGAFATGAGAVIAYKKMAE